LQHKRNNKESINLIPGRHNCFKFQCWTFLHQKHPMLAFLCLSFISDTVLVYFFLFPFKKKYDIVLVWGKKKFNQSGCLEKPLVHRFLAVCSGLTTWPVQHLNQAGDPSGSRFDRSDRPVRFLKHWSFIPWGVGNCVVKGDI
jgi:hypothetical protein